MTQVYPLVPVRDLVVFPGMTLPLYVGRPQSLSAIAAAERAGGLLALVAQRRGSADQPRADELYGMGTLAKLLNRVTAADGTMKLQVNATARVTVLGVEERADYRAARVAVIAEAEGDAVAAALERLGPAFARLFPGVPGRDRDMDAVVAVMQGVLEADAASAGDRLERLRVALEGVSS